MGGLPTTAAPPRRRRPGLLQERHPV